MKEEIGISDLKSKKEPYHCVIISKESIKYVKLSELARRKVWKWLGGDHDSFVFRERIRL